MRNIPMFTAANGMASLILREIPYSGRAYIMVRSVWNGQTDALLQECAQFCRAAGAKEIFASDGKKDLPAEHAYDILRLTAERDAMPVPEQPVELEPVSGKNGSTYLEIYNSCFRDVPGAASYDKKDLQRLMTQENGFLARKDGAYAGVVELDSDGIAGIAVLPRYRGLGYDLALTALQQVKAETLCLKVADTNHRAMALYRRLGFGNDTLVSRWWRIG